MNGYDPWGPVSATLYEIGDSDLVENVVRHTGVSVAWPTLDERSGHSHTTRIRAYKPAIEAAFRQLQDDKKRRFVQVIVKKLLESRVPDEKKRQMLDSLKHIGWAVTEDGTLVLNASSKEPPEVVEPERFDADSQNYPGEDEQKGARSESIGSTHPKAFVSHSTQDHDFVEKFATDLRAKGVDVWYSKWEIKPGDSIRAKIEEGLEGCEDFIVVLSKDSINRPWVQTELDAATVRKISGKVRKIIPVKIEDCGDLPPTLGSLCWEDFSTQPYESALKRVLDGIFEVDVRPPIGIRSTNPSPKTSQSQADFGSIKEPSPAPSSVDVFHVDEFTKKLRNEGFDARGDVFNGTVGVIVGPKGLDRKRMPPDLAAFFFPLWELNDDGNRPLVSARRFHDIYEKRPPDWQVDRSHQRKAGESKVTRTWSRSASLLGSKALEEAIRQALASYFPVDEFPVNIDAVGGQENTYAVVQINNFEAGIDERAKAIPEDFIGAGGMLAAVLTTTERVLTDLRDAGRFPTK